MSSFLLFPLFRSSLNPENIFRHYLPQTCHWHWSGLSYDFYPWPSSILNGFTLTRCDDPAKLVLTLPAIPLHEQEENRQTSRTETASKPGNLKSLGALTYFWPSPPIWIHPRSSYTRGGRPITSISSPNHILLIFSSEPPWNPRPLNIIFF